VIQKDFVEFHLAREEQQITTRQHAIAVDDVDELCFTKLTNSKPVGTLEMYGNTSA
jgi:hypothetical protein